jgi:cytochrome c-type biogenesis protein CcmH
MMRALFAFVIAALCVSSAASADYGPEKLSDPKLEARAVALQRGFRCLVCQGESLDESNSQLADDLRRLIRARIQQGESDKQITDFLVSRYGDVILMKPPLEPGTYLLWFGPLFILVAGGGIAGLIVTRARTRLGPDG